MNEFQQGFGAQLVSTKAKHILPDRIELNEIIIEAGNGEQVDREREKAIASRFGFETILYVGQFTLMFKLLGATQFLGLGLDEL